MKYLVLYLAQPLSVKIGKQSLLRSQHPLTGTGITIQVVVL